MNQFTPFTPAGWTGSSRRRSRSVNIESEGTNDSGDSTMVDDLSQARDWRAASNPTPDSTTRSTSTNEIVDGSRSSTATSIPSSTSLSQEQILRDLKNYTELPSRNRQKLHGDRSVVDEGSARITRFPGPRNPSVICDPNIKAIEDTAAPHGNNQACGTGQTPDSSGHEFQETKDEELEFGHGYGLHSPHQASAGCSQVIDLSMSDSEDGHFASSSRAVDLTMSDDEDGFIETSNDVVDLTVKCEDDDSKESKIGVVDLTMKDEDDDDVDPIEFYPEANDLTLKDEDESSVDSDDEAINEAVNFPVKDEDELSVSSAGESIDRAINVPMKCSGDELEADPPNYTKRKGKSKRKRSTSPHVESEGGRPIGIKKKTSTRASKRGKKSLFNGGVKGIQGSLEFLGYDPIAAYHAEPEVGEAPSFEASTKSKQKADMLSGCPPGSNVRQNKADTNAILKATRVFGHGKVKAKDGRWLLTGMKTPLYNHQIIGVAWMFDREHSTEGPLGGICADSMGLGKTIETLAVMAANPPVSAIDVTECATLIIVPSSILDQWEDEIVDHAKEDTFQYVKIFRSRNEKRSRPVAIQDIVITSYWEISNSCPWFHESQIEALRKKGRKEKGRPEDDDPCHIEAAIEKKLNEGDGGILHQIQWHRVVLDEAHYIKNHLSRRSFAVNAVKGTHRWALSGTPIMNRPEEYFAYMRFLRALPGVRYPEFQLKYCDWSSDICNQRIRALISGFMLHRTVQSQLLGRPLVTLPPPHEHILEIEASAPELIMYRAYEERLLELRHEHHDERDQRRSYKHLFHQLTRLRQWTVDVCLSPRDSKTIFDIADLKCIQKQLDEVSGHDRHIYNEITKWIEEKMADESYSEEDESDSDTQHCQICSDEATDPYEIGIAGCHHIFCFTCIVELGRKAEEEEVQPLCPVCDSAFDLDDLTSKVKTVKPKHKSKKKHTQANEDKIGPEKRGKDCRGYRPKPQPTQYSALEWFAKHDVREGPLHLSSKLKALKEEIRKCARGDPSDKKVIFVQWIQAAVLIGTMLEEMGIAFVYYWGDMSRDQKRRSTTKIRGSPDIKYMISGLKCGGIGLNWTWANHVIIVDPWWNKCVESQAFCRCHRIMQTKECHLIKMSVTGTVDDRLLRLQRKKCLMLSRTTPQEATSEEMEDLMGRHRRRESDDDGME